MAEVTEGVAAMEEGLEADFILADRVALGAGIMAADTLLADTPSAGIMGEALLGLECITANLGSILGFTAPRVFIILILTPLLLLTLPRPST